MLRVNKAFDHFLSKPKQTKIQMLHPTMVFRILGNREGGLIVNVEDGRGSGRKPKFFKELTKLLNTLVVERGQV